MFKSARIKLTFWYLLIIMLISTLFSIVIYNDINQELKKFETMRVRVLEEVDDPFTRRNILRARIAQPDPSIIEASRLRFLTTLGFINLSILAISGVAGYFLAGRTLKPIEEMVEKQKRFISDASHEFRTPIAALRAEIEVNLRDKKLTLAKARKVMESNLEEIDNLQKLSESLLYMAKNGDSKSSHNKMITIETTIKNAIRKVAILARKRQIEISAKFDVKDFKVNEKFTEVFVILLDNAIKYSEDKSSIEIAVKDKNKGISVVFKDHGIGIDKKDLPFIFDRFYRASSSRDKSSDSGFGLGLSIAKSIIDDNNATIHVSSKPGSGTTFTINIS